MDTTESEVIVSEPSSVVSSSSAHTEQFSPSLLRASIAKRRRTSSAREKSTPRTSMSPEYVVLDDHRALTPSQAKKHEVEFGRNVIQEQEPRPWYKILRTALIHPFNFVLFGLAIIAAATQDFRTMIVMLVMVALSVGIRVYQEVKAEKHAQALKKLVSMKVTVIRYPKDKDALSLSSTENNNVEMAYSNNKPTRHDIEIEEVVPGDIVFLSAGDLVPGDVLIYNSKDLFVSQAALTGESLPVEKIPTKLKHKTFKQLIQSPVSKHTAVEKPVKREVQDDWSKDFSNDPNPTELTLHRTDTCFMGTSVVSGKAFGVVIKTGSNTMFGRMAAQLAKRRPPNAFEVGIRRISFMFLGIMAVMLPIVLLISGFIHGNWFQAFLFTVAVAVGLTPEMLPMIVSSNLAKGAVSMARKKVIVKHLESIINLGSMDILCTDKTGTLTQNKVALIKHVDAHGKDSMLPLTFAYLNSYFQTGLKNLLDEAVIDYHENELEDPEEQLVAQRYTKLDELPFDFQRRRMSVLVQDEKQRILLISKGAIVEVLDTCSFILEGTKSAALTKKVKEHISDIAEQMNADGLRVVGVVFKYLEKNPKYLSVKNENGMTFVGFVAFLDPPKDSAKQAIAMLIDKGVEIKVLTGDSPLVCKKVCEQLNLPIRGIVTTKDLDGLSNSELRYMAQNATIFARLTPFQKSEIVKVLKNRAPATTIKTFKEEILNCFKAGFCCFSESEDDAVMKQDEHIVGFMGDGINDANALHEADVAITVNEAVDVAKEMADIILLEKSLVVVATGVRLGRITYGNTIKYVKMAVSSNFGNVLSVTYASAWLPFLPMLPTQIVLQNLLYDFSQLTIPWDCVDYEFIKSPKSWNWRSVMRFMLFIGPISSIFDATTFCFMWFYYGIQTAGDPRVNVFQTAWFIEAVVTQTLIIHLIRTKYFPFVQSTASWPLLFSTTATIICTIAIPFIPGLNTYVSMTPMPAFYFAYLVSAIIGYYILVLIGKTIYIKVFGDWM